MMKMGTLVVAFGAIEKTISQRKKSEKPKPPHGRAAGSGSGRVPSAFGWQLLVTGGRSVGAAGLGASMHGVSFSKSEDGNCVRTSLVLAEKK